MFANAGAAGLQEIQMKLQEHAEDVQQAILSSPLGEFYGDFIVHDSDVHLGPILGGSLQP